MEYAVISFPGEEHHLALDYREFPYAGKFVSNNLGVAVAREEGELLAVASFNEDRSAGDTARIRTISVRTDRQGEGIGTDLLAGLQRWLRDRGFERIRMAVNNPHAFQAAYKAGFCYTGEQSGLSELVMELPGMRSVAAYRAGMALFDDLVPEDMQTYVDEREHGDPPPMASSPPVLTETSRAP